MSQEDSGTGKWSDAATELEEIKFELNNSLLTLLKNCLGLVQKDLNYVRRIIYQKKKYWFIVSLIHCFTALFRVWGPLWLSEPSSKSKICTLRHKKEKIFFNEFSDLPSSKKSKFLNTKWPAACFFTPCSLLTLSLTVVQPLPSLGGWPVGNSLSLCELLPFLDPLQVSVAMASPFFCYCTKFNLLLSLFLSPGENSVPASSPCLCYSWEQRLRVRRQIQSKSQPDLPVRCWSTDGEFQPQSALL